MICPNASALMEPIGTEQVSAVVQAPGGVSLIFRSVCDGTRSRLTIDLLCRSDAVQRSRVISFSPKLLPTRVCALDGGCHATDPQADRDGVRVDPARICVRGERGAG